MLKMQNLTRCRGVWAILLTRVTALLAASVFLTSEALAASDGHSAQGGAYVSLNAGLSHPVGVTNINGNLGSVSAVIPFSGTSNYRMGWSGRIALGYEEQISSLERTNPESAQAPRYRAEVEGLLLRLKRGNYRAGFLNVEPNGELEAQAVFANALVRLFGKRSVRVWAGGGIGFAQLSVGDARRIVNCACLGPAKGNGLAYQGKVVAEMRLTQELQLVLDAAYVGLPSYSTAERPVPVGNYAKSRVVTTNVGVRLNF